MNKNNFFLDKKNTELVYVHVQHHHSISGNSCAGHDFLESCPIARVFQSFLGIHDFSDPLRCWLPICNWTSPSPAFRDATAEGLEMGVRLPLFVCQVGSVFACARFDLQRFGIDMNKQDVYKGCSPIYPFLQGN